MQQKPGMNQTTGNRAKNTPEEPGEFAFLIGTARRLGATDAKVIPVSRVVVENRVPLKCKTGCPTYGTRLMCPPHVPAPDEFRKILSEYRYALLVQFTSSAQEEADVTCSVNWHLFSPDADPGKKERAAAFMAQYTGENNARQGIMLELEKTAFAAGFPFALAFVNGSCRLCPTCNLRNGVCLHPTRARIPEHAVGINMMKTAGNAGMGIRFPVTGHPHPMAILLID